MCTHLTSWIRGSSVSTLWTCRASEGFSASVFKGKQYNNQCKQYIAFNQIVSTMMLTILSHKQKWCDQLLPTTKTASIQTVYNYKSWMWWLWGRRRDNRNKKKLKRETENNTDCQKKGNQGEQEKNQENFFLKIRNKNKRIQY